MDETLIEADICIIGAGVAGITMAMEFINTEYNVVLLEGGGFEYNQSVQESYDGTIQGHSYFPLMSTRLHYFGGTSGHWGGICSIMDEMDFLERDWVKDSGWPIDRSQLDPYYIKGLPILDLGPFEFNASYWASVNPSFTEIPLDKNYLWSKIFQRSEPTRFGEKYKDSIVAAPNIALYTYANVTDISANENITRVQDITIKNFTGKSSTIRAKYFILAANALQNARLLLASNKQNSKGLANSFDVVGRYFMEHPEMKVGEMWLNSKYPFDLYGWTKKVRSELAISANEQKNLEVLNASIGFRLLSADKKRIENVKAWSLKDPLESLNSFKNQEQNKPKDNFFKRHFSKDAPNPRISSYAMHIRMEQAPNPLSRVFLLPDQLDSFGMPRLALNWAFTDIDKRTMRETSKLLGHQIGLSGLGRVKLVDFLLDENDNSMPEEMSGAWHHMGTTRMSNDPKKGVVNSDCKAHGIDNLFIAGSSCFPTVGCSTPTLSIVALSLRLTDHIKTLR